ncbi:SpoIIE family protein phosphatase [Paenibacillus hamazuiensis]|uniref:SpoIIE family protein phosphatase n=1 Tax=Paenibacillus hamazuiensis TaxID=2936508 RepID=UPI00200F34B9|nr:SpoIIE family protein phosphatase [Paenibacillus hamazuiensis]
MIISRDKSVMRVIMFASGVIVLSILLAGMLVYFLTEKEVVRKLKEKDLVFVAGSVASKVDSRIQRAKESSQLLAQDPGVIAWLQSGEKDERLQQYALDKLKQLAKDYDYSNSFIVSAVTNHYWTEEGRIVDTMTHDNPQNEWFFRTIEAKVPVTVQIDYNDKRQDTFAFIDVLMGDPEKPLGVAGVGLSLKSLSDEFAKYRYGSSSHLWLVDNSGTISLSDNVFHDGKSIREFIPDATVNQFLPGGHRADSRDGGKTQVMEFTDAGGRRIDLISYPLQSADWKLIFQIDRSETVSFLEKVKLHTWIATFICIVAMTFLFYFVSRYLANPYKRAVELNKQLEQIVQERTRQLTEQTVKLTDSIDYAQRIQEAILPSGDVLNRVMKEYFLLWQPRDAVGGDFYWVKPAREGYFVAVGDCTGHGVPGALMTMLSVSILNLVADNEQEDNPAVILNKVNKLVKQMLNRDRSGPIDDDGLDLGLCHVNGREIVFAGAKCSLYVKNGPQLNVIKGDRRSIGSRRTADHYTFENHRLTLSEDNAIYMTTDGYLDQNGGLKNYSFGKQRFIEMIEAYAKKPLAEQERVFREQLLRYMGKEPQRDDITLLGFRV